MFKTRNLVRIDGIAGLTAGVVVLTLHDLLCDLYQLPRWLIVTNGIANILYGCYSTTLASLDRRSMTMIVILVIANLGWAIVCIVVAVMIFGSATLLGVAHAVVEAIFVGGLGLLEWRYRNVLCKV